jgi:hypothetical protein
MLCGLHRVYFNGNEGPEGATHYELWLDTSKRDLARIPGRPKEGMVETSTSSAKSTSKRRLNGTLRGTAGRRVRLKERRARTLRRGMTMLKGAEASNDKRAEACEPKIGARLVE